MNDIETTLANIISQAHTLFNISLPQSVIDGFRGALESDFAMSGNLPSGREIGVMMNGSDDDEDSEKDSELDEIFPATYDELTSLWQLQ